MDIYSQVYLTGILDLLLRMVLLIIIFGDLFNKSLRRSEKIFLSNMVIF